MRSPKKKPFSNSRKLSKFKIINWPEYNNILRNRGRIDFMISKNLGENWYEQNNNGKKRGGQIQVKPPIGGSLIPSIFAIIQYKMLSYMFTLK